MLIDKIAAWERQTRDAFHSGTLAPGDPPLIGTVETVTERLISRLKDYKIGNVDMAFQFGTMPHEMATRNMTLCRKGHAGGTAGDRPVPR